MQQSFLCLANDSQSRKTAFTCLSPKLIPLPLRSAIAFTSACSTASSSECDGLPPEVCMWFDALWTFTRHLSPSAHPSPGCSAICDPIHSPGRHRTALQPESLQQSTKRGLCLVLYTLALVYITAHHGFAVAHLGQGEHRAPKGSAACQWLAQRQHDECCANDQAIGLHIIHIQCKLWLPCSQQVTASTISSM